MSPRSQLRLAVVGGLTSFRALFTWLTPWVMVPVFVVQPLFQVLFFVYVGRAAGVGDSGFYLIGNAVQFASIPCLLAMSITIADERRSGTLPLVLLSPAPRLPLFMGRSLPVVLNGFAVALATLVLGGALLGVHPPLAAVPGMVLAIALSAVACTGLGLFLAAVALRVRESAVLANVGFGTLLIFSGANVPLERLPSWMSVVGHCLPLAHGIDATRALAKGATLSSVKGALLAEVGVGLVYVVLGMGLLGILERQARRHASLEVA